MNRPSLERLALFGALLSAFAEMHPFCDHWAQDSDSARCKRLYGSHLVYRDGAAVDEAPTDRRGEPTMTATECGRRAVIRHVTSYTAIQTGAAFALTRAFGHRVPPTAMLAGALINATTHAAIDRGAAFLWLVDHAGKRGGKRGYLDHCHALRQDKDGNIHAELNGPGTAWIELDAAAHRAIGVVAAAATTWLATRKHRRT